MNEAAERPRRHQRRRKIVIAMISIGVVIIVLRHPILESIAAGLVYADRSAPGADVLAISGEDASREALLWLAKNEQTKLLLADKPPPRVVQIGAAKSGAERVRELSKAAGIPEDRIEILMGESMREVLPAQNIKQWLSANPRRHLLVLCDQFRSRELRRSMDQGLGASMASRTAIRPLPDRRYTVENWWSTRLGIRGVFDAYLGLTCSVLGLESPEPPPYLTPDQYEDAFLRTLKLNH